MKFADINKKKMKMKTASRIGIRFNLGAGSFLFLRLGALNTFYSYISSFLVPNRSISFTENSSISLMIFSDFELRKV